MSRRTTKSAIFPFKISCIRRSRLLLLVHALLLTFALLNCAFSLVHALAETSPLKRSNSPNEQQQLAQQKKQQVEGMAPAGLAGPICNLGGVLLEGLSKQPDGRGKNVVLSPVSIHQALSMVLLGADLKSETRDELKKTLGYGKLAGGEQEIEQRHVEYANLLTDYQRLTNETLEKRREFNTSDKSKLHRFEVADAQPKSPVVDLLVTIIAKNKGEPKPEFVRDLVRYFHASLNTIDDAKPETKKALLKSLNAWGHEAGFGQPVIEAKNLDDHFEALLVSAIRVEAFWFQDFHQYDSDKVFYNYGLKEQPVAGKGLSLADPAGARFVEFTSAQRATVKYLHEAASKAGAFQTLAQFPFRAVQLPLRGELSFTILQPWWNINETASMNSTLAKLEKLTIDLFSNQSGDSSSSHLVEVFNILDQPTDSSDIDFIGLPKFKFESDLDLKPLLRAAGLRRVFERDRAQVSNMTGRQLHVSDIKHKAMIEATKTGIKAAGLTTIKMASRAAYIKSETVRVIIERPFLFVVRHKKIPLFVGKLTNL